MKQTECHGSCLPWRKWPNIYQVYPFPLKTFYSRLSLFRSPRDILKYFEISIPRHIRFAELRKNKYFHKWTFNLAPKVKNILKILWKRGEIAPSEQFHLFSTIFCYLFLNFHVKTGSRFSLRDKRLFEISVVEITGVACILISNTNANNNTYLIHTNTG